MALLFGACSAAFAQEADHSLIEQFASLCLTSAVSIEDQVAMIDRTSGWVRTPFPQGGLHKADKRFAWKGNNQEAPFQLLLSQDSRRTKLSTLCELRTLPLVSASNYIGPFSAVMERAGLKMDEQLPPHFYAFQGQLSNQKSAHAVLASSLVRRGVALLGSRYLSLSILN